MLFSLHDPQKRQQAHIPGDRDAATAWPTLFDELAQIAKDPRLKHYYSQGMVSADTPIRDVPLLAIDFETTGLTPQNHGIVSIGAIPMTLNRIQMSGARHWVTKPRRSLTDESVVIHGITHSDIESAPDLDELLDDMLQMFAGRVWVVHYRGIERPFFQHALNERLSETLEFPVIDTMALEARLHRVKPISLWSRMLGRQQQSIRLADSRARYNLPFYQPHGAVTDALACGELLQAQVATHYSPDDPVGTIWVP